METTDKLRDWARHVKDNPHLGELTDLGVQGLYAIAYGIEREVADRFVALPLDADGVPIRVGDTVEYPNGRRDVVRFITFNDNMPTFNEQGWVASKCRHAKPRTVEDVLEEFIAAYDEWDCNTYDDERTAGRRELFAKYADEIRELMEVDR